MAFKNHESSVCHREAVEVIICLPSTTQHIGTLLSEQYTVEMAKSRRMLLKISNSIRFLARQALPLRGHYDDSDGNLYQLLKLQGEDRELVEWLQRRVNKYTSPEIQDDLIKVMATHVLRSISEKLHKSPFVTIMVDEMTDITNQEQVTVVMRRIDEELVVYEELLGLYAVSCINAATLFAVIKDTMLRLNLPTSKLRGQCYNGCSTMSGIQSGLAKRVQDEESRAVYTHCYSHSLNLAASDSVRKSKFMKSALETTHEITKLIKLSPRRDAIFQELQADTSLSSERSSVSIKLLYPTRWTACADPLSSILENYGTAKHLGGSY